MESQKVNNKKLKTEDFVEYSYWLSQSHRNPNRIKHERILKNDKVIIEPPTSDFELSTKHRHNPVVEYEEIDGVVKTVEITCSCGEKVRLALDYDSDSNQKNM